MRVGGTPNLKMLGCAMDFLIGLKFSIAGFFIFYLFIYYYYYVFFFFFGGGGLRTF